MIHLDTSYLIDAINPALPESTVIHQWLSTGEQIALSSLVWSEFCNGPLTPVQREEALVIVMGEVIPFSRREAEVAARLFNATGRRRSLRHDCLIAATALVAGARLATQNTDDFRLFVPHGLVLAGPA